MANNTSPTNSSLRLGPSPAIGSLGYYEMFSPVTPPAYTNNNTTPPPLSSTRSVPLHPVGPPDDPLPTPPVTPLPFDLTVLRMKMEIESLKIRLVELERKLAPLEKHPVAEDELSLRCDCSACVMGI